MIQPSPQLQEIINVPKFGGLNVNSALYPGHYQISDQQNYETFSGNALAITIQKGDLIQISSESIESFSSLSGFYLATLSNQNISCLQSLGLKKSRLIQPKTDSYHLNEIKEKLKARSVDFEQLEFIKVDLVLNDNTQNPMIVLQATDYLLLILLFPISNLESVILGEDLCCYKVKVQKEEHSLPPLPDYIGQVKDEFLVNRATAKAYEIKKGECIQIIDFAGQQCSDFMAVNAHSLDQGKERYIDSTVTRSLVRGAYPMPGLFSKFFDQDFVPLLEVVQDTVGRHDTFGFACTAKGYEDRGFPGHVNCSDNISNVFLDYSIAPKKGWPAINFFFNTWILPTNNQLQSDTAWSRAGDYVLLKALTDLVCVSTACPDDIDPINGWNPTDVLVRIYSSLSQPKKSIGYRPYPQSILQMSKESPFYPRTSRLTKQFTAAAPYWNVSHYEGTGAAEEYWACKNAAIIQDMSNLRILDIYGEDAEELLDLCITRNVKKLSSNRAIYALLCNEFGSIIDDGTLFRLSDNLLRWCCGSDESAYQLKKVAQEKNLNAWIRNMSKQLCNLAIQGPNSYNLLKDIIYTLPNQPSFKNLKWFGSLIGRFYDNQGIPFFLSRTGFTGELGYEIFCAQKDAVQIWDILMKAGKTQGLTPMGTSALNSIRIEAGLMVAGYDFGGTVLPAEANLSFAVDCKKENFIGKLAIEKQQNNQRYNLYGLILEGNEVPMHGDTVYLDRKQVGVITSATRSHQLGKTIALTRIEKSLCQENNKLEIGKLDGFQKRLKCKTTPIPFIDPKREKPRT